MKKIENVLLKMEEIKGRILVTKLKSELDSNQKYHYTQYQKDSFITNGDMIEQEINKLYELIRKEKQFEKVSDEHVYETNKQIDIIILYLDKIIEKGKGDIGKYRLLGGDKVFIDLHALMMDIQKLYKGNQYKEYNVSKISEFLKLPCNMNIIVNGIKCKIFSECGVYYGIEVMSKLFQNSHVVPIETGLKQLHIYRDIEQIDNITDLSVLIKISEKDYIDKMYLKVFNNDTTIIKISIYRSIVTLDKYGKICLDSLECNIDIGKTVEESYGANIINRSINFDLLDNNIKMIDEKDIYFLDESEMKLLESILADIKITFNKDILLFSINKIDEKSSTNDNQIKLKLSKDLEFKIRNISNK